MLVKLCIDDVCVCHNREFFPLLGSVPMLTATLQVGGQPLVIEVVIQAFLTCKAAIFVDGVQIGGDVLSRGDDARRFRTTHRELVALGAEGSAVAVPVRVLPIETNQG